MATSPEPTRTTSKRKKQHHFRRAVLRGLAVVLPPLLTIIVFVWAWSMIVSYVLAPLEAVARFAIVKTIQETKTEFPDDTKAEDVFIRRNGGAPEPLSEALGKSPENLDINKETAKLGATFASFKDQDGTIYVPLGNAHDPTGEHGEWIPEEIESVVLKSQPKQQLNTAREYYDRYVQVRWLKRELTIPIFLVVFLLLLYLAGKLFAAGIGSIFVGLFEKIIHRVPIIRVVYSAAKQVTDFIFKEREEVQYTTVVAVEYPRQGLYSVGFVTGESFVDLKNAAGEPVISVLMPTSPIPGTGFTITVRKSETVQMDITVDQAIQFVVSCGVVVPPHQQWSKNQAAAHISTKVKKAIAAGDGNGESGGTETAAPAGEEGDSGR